MSKMTAPPRLRDEQKHPVVVERQVNRAIWATALAEADGDARKIEYVSPTEVIVHR